MSKGHKRTAISFGVSTRNGSALHNCGGVCLFALAMMLVWGAPAGNPVPQASPDRSIAWSESVAKVAAQYLGGGLLLTATPDGARLRCAFQKLEGEITREGLWLVSTAAESKAERFQVKASAVGRAPEMRPLASAGAVRTSGDVAGFLRPGLAEEYRVSVDGVRQDFVIAQRPAGAGALRVELKVTGARAEALASGARLVLAGSGRQLDYHRLHVSDADGKVLPARMEVAASDQLAVVVDDAGAVYPVRIDPTFSDANWQSMGGIPGASHTVNAVAVDLSGHLYIGGIFDVAGDVQATRIAKWDGSVWSALGSGMNNRVEALAVVGDDLYAGGAFTTAGGVSANRIAKWDGHAWSALGAGMDDTVEALAVAGTNLYAAGAFTTAGGTNASRIAKWDGSAWSALGSGFGSTIETLAVSGTNLYAGGSFILTTTNWETANYIARWDGSSWSALGSGMNRSVTALAVSGTDLYAGGTFTTAGGVSANRIAKWDGSAWSALGSGMNKTVYGLAISGGNLYAGGEFTTAGGVSAHLIAKWNGSAWSAIGSGMEGDYDARVQVLAVSGANLYAGGLFHAAGGVGANNVAKWDGSSWSTLGAGMNNTAWALAVSGSDLFVGGSFMTAGSVRANGIAKWDGSTWSALGAGIDGTVSALAVSGSNLYAGGTFTTAGGVGANYIAKWDGNSWSPLGGGVNNSVMALAVLGNDLYVGGWFSTAGGTNANKIAKWDGSSWSPLGAGMGGVANSVVYALAASGSNLYAGGVFSTAGGVMAPGVARWNGESWSALGSGTSQRVWALAAAGTNLYAAGDFSSAGGVSANNIARWDGNAWSALGSGLNSTVYGLAITGSDLYAGGLFTTAGGVSVNYIAKWDGSTWSRLGSGIGGAVTSLAIAGTNLYVGGDFTTAGGKPSGYIARASVPLRTGPPIILEQPQSQLVESDAGVTLSVDVAGEQSLFYQWFKDGSPLSNTSDISGVESNALTFAFVRASDAGSYFVMVSNAWGVIISSNAVLTVVPAIPLAEALDAPDLVWTTGGDARWRGQTNTTFDGVDAAQSGVIGCDEQNWMETTVNGPGTLSFWWKISPTAGSGSLDFLVNDQWVDLIYYEVDWNQVVVPLPPGPQVLHWCYTFYSFNTNGSSAWVDQVSFLPDAAPTLREQPQDQTVKEGSEVAFTVSAIGTAPLFYQWRKNGTPLSNGSNVTGADTPTLTLTDVQTNDAGGYSVVVTNFLGSVTSTVAVLTVLVPEPPPLVVSPCHPVANSAQAEFALSSAFDGTHFLIGLRGNTNSSDAVGAQRLLPTGAKVGPLISLGRKMDGFLDGPRIVWVGGNHLLVWTDAATQHPSSASDVYAQFISPSGHLVSNAFGVCEAPEDQYARGAAYDGANFLVIWSAADGLRGRLVSPAGQLLGNELLFTPENVQEAAAVAWGGSHYLATWVQDVGAGYAAKGRLVTSSGQLGAVLQFSQNDSASYNPISVAYGGDRFFVVWHHNTDAGADWNLRGRIVAPDGSMLGDELVLTSGPEDEIAWANNVAFDGQHFLVVWTAYAGSPGSAPGTVWGRYYSRDGVPVGAAFTIESAGAGTLGLGLSAGGGQVMAVINRDAFSSASDVCVRFIIRPFVHLSAIGSNSVQVTFNGVLQSSTNLQTWMDHFPQPSSPWIKPIDPGPLFLRARAEP